MLLQVFTIYDSKVEAYLPPFMLKSKGEALRVVTDEVRSDKKSNLNTHPEDFILFHLGSWDDSSAEYVLHPPYSMCVLSELKTLE